MDNRNRLYSTMIAILLATVVALLLIGALNGPATASPQACFPIYYVDLGGGCGGQTPCYTTVQAAVDAACVGREVRVAQGTYTGVQVRDSVTQMVYISRSVDIRGGYSTGNWSTPHPDTQPTILDAQGQGRVFYIIGSDTEHVTPTLQGLRLTNGRIADADGGGIRAYYADMVISGCHVYSNTATGSSRQGGGLWIYLSSGSVLTGNHIYSNTATGNGGGLHLAYAHDSVVAGNYIYSNTGGWAGGGLLVTDSDRAHIDGNHIHHNRSQNGGGAWIRFGDDPTVMRNNVHNNVAFNGDGGGIYVDYSDRLLLANNHIYSNQAPDTWGDGGGVWVEHSPDAELAGNRVYSNTAGRNGAGIIVQHCGSASLTHNWSYGNTGASFGGGIFVGRGSNSEVVDNDVFNNSGASLGGGLFLDNIPYSLVEGNHVYNNQADSRGGGLLIRNLSDYTLLTGNHVHDNSAGNDGGGFWVGDSNNVSLTSNQIHDNEADYTGAGIQVDACQALTLESNMVTDNQLTAFGQGAGILLWNSDAQLLHTTIANNTGGEGQGIYTTMTSSLQLENTIIVSHEIGIETDPYNPDSTASLNYTLWGAPGSNISDTLGSGIVTTNNMWLDPAFEAPASGDYHITYGSPAKDAATDVGVTTDVDGDSRVVNSPPDIGADEYACHVRLNESSTPYPSVQAAIDAATPWDTVRVAGVCRTLERNSSEWQVAYINKNLTLRGGYSTDFATWDPEQYPTTLDPNGRGRSVYSFGDITSRLESLRMVNGVDGFGAGIVINQSNAVISDCHILNNVATFYGGGLYVSGTDDVTLVNTVIADNSVTNRDTGKAAAIMDILGHITMLHTTLARNTGGDGTGITLLSATVSMSNTILVGHSIGITTVTPNSIVWLESTLWGNGDWANDVDWLGVGTVYPGTNNYRLEPGFVDAENGDYHLMRGSPAIDLGVDAGVSTDIDGQWRPVGLAPDLGADEVRLQAFLPLVLRSY